MCEVPGNIVVSDLEALRTRIAPGLVRTPLLVPEETINPAAVLIPIVPRETPTVLLTLRDGGLSLHAGQISFLGGRFQREDGSFLETALREAEEEIGIARDYVEVAGFIDPYRTRTGYTVIPAVGLLRAGFTLKRNEPEVAEIFEVPLDFLFDPKNHGLVYAERDGVMREFHSMRYRNYHIWGATAGMIVNFAKRLPER